MSKEWRIKKNQMDLQFRNWVSISNVFLGSGLTAVIAFWPLVDRTGFTLQVKIFLDFAVSGILILLGILSRSRAHSYMERISGLNR